MLIKYALSAVLLLAPFAAQAAPLVNPVTVAAGGTVHLTPIDQNSMPISILECTLSGVLAPIATHVKDATGFVITGGSVGTLNSAKISCSNGGTPVVSPTFTVTVTPAPYTVTQVGTTSP
jgi:hypothetical protein